MLKRKTTTDTKHSSARWLAVLLASLALGTACDSATNVPVDAESEDDDTSPSNPIKGEGDKPDGGKSPTTDPPGPSDKPDAGPTTPGTSTGKGDGKDVITMGDSYMRVGGLFGPGPDGTEVSLEKASKQTFRKYGNVGGSLVTAVSVLNGVIPKQFDTAKAENPDIKTVVIAAGGNDLGDKTECHGPATEAEVSAACNKKIDEVEAAIVKLIATFAKAGVKDVVWVGYGPIKTSKAQMSGTMERLNSVRKAKCVANDPALGLRCHFVENYADLKDKIGSDGAHPTPAGFDVIGKNVWARMEKEDTRR